jgi:hypothetical protein
MMRNRIVKLAATVAAVFLVNMLVVMQASAAAQDASGTRESTAAAPKLDNATCLTCHDEGKGGGKLPGAKNNLHPPHGVNSDKFGKSVHGDMQCIACHKEITDSVTPHKLGTAPRPDCVSCHQALWDAAQKENLTKEKARLGVVVANIETYKASFHARPNKEDRTHVNAACDDCHNTHTFNVPPQGTTKRTEWHLTIPNVCGEKCHSDELDDYKTSVHGKKVLEEGDQKAAVCTDCHTTHDIANTSKETFKTSITEKCGGCHVENLRSYRATYHGQVNKLGYGYTAKCYDCHGSHDILPPEDPASRVSPKNRLKTCQKCHKEATQGFVTFNPHANNHDFGRYPQVWIVSRFMWALLGWVFAFFWLHTGLWWYREARDRRARKSHPHGERRQNDA